MTDSYSFKELFNKDISTENGIVKINKIVIPIIQRDYAQGRMSPEIIRIRERFLKALYDAIIIKPITLDFIYGDIDKEGVLTLLDGQQRLTTLFLLYWYIAKKEKISFEEYEFLTHFNYKTRYSARDFCEKLIQFNPTFEEDCLSTEIINQFWFPLEWKKDPTISSMLVMIDNINKWFNNTSDIWDKLDNSIRFFFLPIQNIGLTDELYIKMNSRGKPLSTFENFKAELELELRNNNQIDYNDIINNIDKNWTDLLWKFKDDNNSVDVYFLHYFRFVCDVICFKNGDTPLGNELDEIDLIKEYFKSDNEKCVENIELFVNYFDCWDKVNKEIGIDNFFNKFLSRTHENGKIIYNSENTNLFKDVIDKYGVMVANTARRQFTLQSFVLFFAFLTYALNMEQIDEKDFARRIRIVNNLINNSENEISSSTARTGGNRIPAILSLVESIVIKGVFDGSNDLSFNSKQIIEEKEKIEWTTNNPELSDRLFELEDHILLYGKISVIGLENFELFDKFKMLFECDYEKVGMALLTFGDYSVKENGYRYQLGSIEKKSYMELFHSNSENVKMILCSLLRSSNILNDDYLDKLIHLYISKCEAEKLYDWRYYYLKYDVFRPKRFGNYYWKDKKNMPYEFSVIPTEKRLSENAYVPFLKEIDSNKISKIDFGEKIIDDNICIEMKNDRYLIKDQSDNTEDSIMIMQDENGIDKENRIDKILVEYKKGKFISKIRNSLTN